MTTEVYISVDIEGLTGFVHPAQDETEEMATRMAAEVNAVIEGLTEATDVSRITVADAHGRMRTLRIDDLDARVELVRGRNRPLGMVDGADENHAFAIFIGYHDRPGSGGVLEHTFSGSLDAVSLDGIDVGETELNAAMLATLDIPLAMVAGDDQLRTTLEDRMPDVAFVVTKNARGVQSAINRSIHEVTEELTDTASMVGTDPPTAATLPIGLSSPVEVSIRFSSVDHAELATLWPEVHHGDDSRTVTHIAEDIPSMYRFVRAAAAVNPQDR